MIWEDLYLCYLLTTPIDMDMVNVLWYGTSEQAEQYYISHCDIGGSNGNINKD